MARESYLLPSGFSALSASHPILPALEAMEWEKALLDGAEAEWNAMSKVGQLLADEIWKMYRMGRYDSAPRSAVGLIGKGHNGGDALLALCALSERVGLERVSLLMPFRESDLKPNADRALGRLKERLEPEALRIIAVSENEDEWLARVGSELENAAFDIAIDGLFGMQFKPPLREPARSLIGLINDTPKLRLRVAVDAPSGVSDHGADDEAFRADITFATGICKRGVADPAHDHFTGYIRYLDIGFFEDSPSASTRVLVDSILDPLRELRYSGADKRSFGHLFIMAGSASMPGALAMCVGSALRSGVGLVSVFAPERHVPSLSCLYPEAMWVPWPETPGGGLALEGMHLLRERASRADAMVIGPGMGSERETTMLIREAVLNLEGPALLDADALRPEVFDAVMRRSGRTILTPHVGEYARVFGELKGDKVVSHAEIRRAAERFGGVVVLKGHNIRVASADTSILSPAGNAVLARGGSGDVLSGMMGALLAMMPQNPLEAACMGTYWHGVAADLLAMDRGQNAVRTTDLFDFFAEALRENQHAD